MEAVKIYTEDILDKSKEIHYAFHNSLSDITIKHTHDFYEIFLITSGSVKHVINNHEQIISAGTLVFIRPTDVHFYAKYNNSQVELLNLAFPKYVIDELLSYLGDGFDSQRLLKTKLAPSIILSGTEKKILVNRFEKLHLLPLNQRSETRTALRILLAEIITNYFSKDFWLEKNGTPKWLEMTRIEMQKKENFVNGFTAMVEISNKTKEHLCREFKKNYEITPTEFVNELRLNYSANLLVTTNESIPFISLESGFENLSHYYHLFKKRFSESPANFRKKNSKNLIP